MIFQFWVLLWSSGSSFLLADLGLQEPRSTVISSSSLPLKILDQGAGDGWDDVDYGYGAEDDEEDGFAAVALPGL
ncbi:unnamed protein product [Linum trigynum]|uniref:Secreted protein n=1 Tax=Linum trigynum TaxID=586398 RepID=A0AAV2FCL6_9ROSI